MKTANREDGFALIELLVATIMSLLLFAAVTALLIVEMHGQQGSDQRNAAQDRARLGIDLIARQLRNIASPISSPKLVERATPYDLVFQTVGAPSGSNVSGAERVRYCVPNDSSTGSSSLEELVGQVQTWTTSTPPTISWGTSSCPDTSPSDSSKNYTIVVPYVMNRYKGDTTHPLFTYDNGTAPSDLTKITSVQMDLYVNPTPTALRCAASSCTQSELRSAVYLRNQLRPPVAQFTWTPTTNGGVLLNGGISYSPDDEDLTFSWQCTSASCPSGLTGATDGLIDWHPGAGVYTVVLTVTDPTGLSTTSSPQTVTVT